MPDPITVIEQKVEPNGLRQQLTLHGGPHQTLEGKVTEVPDTPHDLLQAWTRPDVWANFRLALPKPRVSKTTGELREDEDASKAVWGIAPILIRDAQHHHKSRCMLTPKRSEQWWIDQTAMPRSLIWKAIKVLMAMELLREGNSGRFYLAYFAPDLFIPDDLIFQYEFGQPNEIASADGESFGQPNIDSSAGRTCPGGRARLAEHVRLAEQPQPRSLRSACAPAPASVRFGIKDSKTPIRTEPEEQGALSESDRIGISRGRPETDKAFVASLTDAKFVHALMVEQLERRVIRDCEQHRLRVFTAAVHAARCKPRVNPIDETGRRRMFWCMVYGIARPTPHTEKLFKFAKGEEENEASAMMKRIAFGDPRSRGVFGNDAPIAKPQRPHRPVMTPLAHLADTVRTWAVAKGFDIEGRIAENEARRRGLAQGIEVDAAAYRRGLAEADEAIEAWQNWDTAAQETQSCRD